MRMLLIALVVVAGCGDDAAPACPSTAELQGELNGAAAGETVVVGACVVDGPLTVPAGVRLEGAGEGLTTVRLATPGTGRAVTLAPGAMTPTTLAGLTVESDGCAAVVAIGAGAAALEQVTVRARRGVGIGAQDLDMLAVRDVSVYGALDAGSIETAVPPLPPFACGSGEIATHGVVVASVRAAVLHAVEVEGFGRFGVLAVGSGLEWIGGNAESNLGTALEVWGGTAHVERVAIAGTRDGAGAIESYGVVLAGGTDAETQDLRLQDGDGYGVFHDGSSAHHQSLLVRDHGFAGVWAQNTSDFEIGGTSTFTRNGFAGVAVLGSSGVALRGLSVDETAERTRVEGVRTVRAADGIQLLDTDAVLEDVTLQANPRVGVVIDLAGASTSRVTLTNVGVEGTGTALGAIAQNGTIEPGWDAAVTRGGDTGVNDEAFRGALEAAGAVGPPCFPPIDAIESAGVAELVGP